MKGYWLVMGQPVTNADAQAEYVRLWSPVAAKYGARVVNGAGQAVLQEALSTTRVLFVEFPDLAAAQACYNDPEYQAACEFVRQGSKRELLIFEGQLS